jgi:flagellar biosynthesis component FlhA
MLHMYVQIIFCYIPTKPFFWFLGIKYVIQKIRHIHHHSFPSDHLSWHNRHTKRLSSDEKKQQKKKKKKKKKKVEEEEKKKEKMMRPKEI